MLAKLLGAAFGFETLAIAIAIAFTCGSISGWRVTKKFDDAAKYEALAKAREADVAALQAQLTTINAAAKADQARALTAETLRTQAEEAAHALAKKIGDSSCFGGDDAGRVRELWKPAPAKRKSP